MKKILILVMFIIACTSSFFAQTTDSITIKKAFGGYQFYQNDKRLRMSELVETIKTNEQAFQHIKPARLNNTLATIMAGAGGFMVGWQLGAAVGGGNPNWTTAGIG